MAVPVALLMIGGEFDLSAGVMVTTSALISSMFSYQMTANTWVGVGVSLLVTLAIGAFNGIMLTRTRLPSFIITLGTFLMLTGTEPRPHQADQRHGVDQVDRRHGGLRDRP